MRIRDTSGKYPINDWSKPLEDLDKVAADIREMLLQKYGAAADGDCPVDFMLIDRTKYQAMNFQPLPYDYEAETPEDFDKLYQAASLNLSLALGNMDSVIRMQNMMRSIRKEMKDL